MNLQNLANKLHEYNKDNCTAWALLFCTPSLEEVYIVHEEDNHVSPDWWPNNVTGETIERALELIPKPKVYKVRIFNAEFGCVKSYDDISKEMLSRIKDILMEPKNEQ